MTEREPELHPSITGARGSQRGEGKGPGGQGALERALTQLS